MEPTQQQIWDSLKKLGDTPSAVAATLAAGGFKGKMCQSLICPISLYLHKEFPDNYVEVGGTIACVEWTVSDLPQAVSDFILHFDAGDYAELVATTDAEKAFLEAYAHAALAPEER